MGGRDPASVTITICRVHISRKLQLVAEVGREPWPSDIEAGIPSTVLPALGTHPCKVICTVKWHRFWLESSEPMIEAMAQLSPPWRPSLNKGGHIFKQLYGGGIDILYESFI